MAGASIHPSPSAMIARHISHSPAACGTSKIKLVLSQISPSTMPEMKRGKSTRRYMRNQRPSSSPPHERAYETKMTIQKHQRQRQLDTRKRPGTTMSTPQVYRSWRVMKRSRTTLEQLIFNIQNETKSRTKNENSFAWALRNLFVYFLVRRKKMIAN